MMIDQNNYEAYLLDYLEGNISEEDKMLLLDFLKNHPELEADLDLDINTKLTPTKPVFEFKEQLLKHEADKYEMPVLDYLLIKQNEEGLTGSEKAELLLAEPNDKARQEQSTLYDRTRLQADESIKYNSKSKLRRFVLLPVIKQVIVSRGAAAAAIIALLMSVWWFANEPIDNVPVTATIEDISELQEKKVLTADSKIVEKKIAPGDTQPSKDSLLKLSSNPMELKVKPIITKDKKPAEGNAQYIAGIRQMERLDRHRPINAFEHGLNVMMPQYMNNNLLREELASIYRQIEEEDNSPGLSLAFVESGVKVMNFLSKESVKMQKYYNSDGKVVGYKLKADKLEVNRRMK